LAAGVAVRGGDGDAVAAPLDDPCPLDHHQELALEETAKAKVPGSWEPIGAWEG
jgi:hypothetical protein